MKISLFTDAPKHNLALMKMSSFFKKEGHEVKLNPIRGLFWKDSLSYASVLFDFNEKKFKADHYGGPAFGGGNLPIPETFPDYNLFKTDFSLGYTFRYCPRNCEHCKVTKMEKDKNHHSIWEFHDSKFKKICLLNNNTFFDPEWKETFEEIWDAKLTVRDENGYDLRLIDGEKACFLKKTKWDHGPKFAWDRMKDESLILKGFDEINKAGIRGKSIYVLIGYDTTIEEDIYRCQKIHDLGHNPFPMIYEKEKNEIAHHFRRMIYARYYRKERNIEKAWKEYKKKTKLGLFFKTNQNIVFKHEVII